MRVLSLTFDIHPSGSEQCNTTASNGSSQQSPERYKHTKTLVLMPVMTSPLITILIRVINTWMKWEKAKGSRVEAVEYV